jgi:predicted ribonuclease YlaK
VRNNVEVAGSQKLGALPGEQEDKLMPWLMPLADILGDEEALRQAIEQHEIEPVHLGYIRGRSFQNSIIFVDEAENLTTDNVKLIIGRAGQGSEIWFLGDES